MVDLSNSYDRINNLYYILDKNGRKVMFRLNAPQSTLYYSLWYCNIILKARQLGISTFVCILFLDRCIFNSNQSAGIVAQTREDAESMFKRIKFAYDNLYPDIKTKVAAKNDSARELVFSNGSSIRVGTSMRGSTLQYLHISEFGKICAKYPDKAEEIITGSLNTVAPGQYIFIESTAEGREGYFYEICKKAQQNLIDKKELSKLEYRFHFFPWYLDPEYRIGSPLHLTQEHHDYFLSLKAQNIELESEQKYWYAYKSLELKENMPREYPSTPEEAWQQSTEGCYYAKQMHMARIEKRIGKVGHDPELLVHTAWDLGYNDLTSIWFFQVYGKEVRLIDYVEGQGESLSHWLDIVITKPYVYDRHLAPHDILVHEYSTGMTRQSVGRKKGINLIPVPKVQLISGIDATRNLLHRCWFDEEKCKKGIIALENYKKEWNDKMGTWNSKPCHNEFSHSSDAFRTLSTGLFYITGQKTQAEKDREKLEALKDASGQLPGSMFYDNDPNKEIMDNKRRSIF
jgi:hypothetical protein